MLGVMSVLGVFLSGMAVGMLFLAVLCSILI